jgi:hypothetical protein
LVRRRVIESKSANRQSAGFPDVGLNNRDDVGKPECPIQDEVQRLAGLGQPLDDGGGVGLALAVNKLPASGPLRV